MVNLISSLKLQNLNIDTVERAIVFAALVLRTAIVGQNNLNSTNNKIKITTEAKGKKEIKLKLDVLLPIDSYKLSNYGNPIYAIKSFETIDINLDEIINYAISPSFTQYPIIPDFPFFINDFETYLFYYASILLISLEDNRNETIKITPKDTNFDGSEIRLQINLFLNVKKWFLGNNLIECVNRIASDYVDVSNFNYLLTTISTLNQNILLTNNQTLEN